MNGNNVTLRKKPLKNGGFSLYLDVYRAGVRKYEYLRLYLVPENTRADKAKNKETMAFAEAVRAKRVCSDSKIKVRMLSLLSSSIKSSKRRNSDSEAARL